MKPILSPYFIKPGLPIIDWGNELSLGLTGAYLPGLGSKKVMDLSGVGANLVCGTGNKWVPTPEGMALDQSAQVSGQGCFAVATKAQQPTTTATAFWRGILLGTPAANEYIFGVTFQDGSAAPFNAYTLVYMSAGQVQASAGTQVGAGQWAVGMSAPVNVPTDYAVVMNLISGDFFGYMNGAEIGTNAIVPPDKLDYGVNPQLTLGGTSSSAGANVRHLVGFTWNRVLSPSELEDMHLNPYQLFLFPQDRLLLNGWAPPQPPSMDERSIVSPRPTPIAY